MPEGDFAGELLRARQRLHDLEKASWVLHERIAVVEKRVDKIEPTVDAIARADQIADAVADKMHEFRGSMFSTSQKIGAGIVGAVAVADFVRNLIMG